MAQEVYFLANLSVVRLASLFSGLVACAHLMTLELDLPVLSDRIYFGDSKMDHVARGLTTGVFLVLSV